MQPPTETVHLRASYCYASAGVRDDAVSAALAAMTPDADDAHYALSAAAGARVDVDIALALFGDHDLTVLALLQRGAVASTCTRIS